MKIPRCNFETKPPSTTAGSDPANQTHPIEWDDPGDDEEKAEHREASDGRKQPSLGGKIAD
ncbi:MAG: hypothetical protein V9E81_06735 [Marmoricola sp.]